MDEATLLGRAGERIPPCDEPATEEVCGYRLCAGCAEAVRMFINFSERVLGTDECGGES